MNEEYLWNRTGETDPEIARLEQLLRPLQYSGKQRPGKSISRWWLAVAAILLLGMATVPLMLRGPLTKWHLSDGQAIRAGQTIETGASQETKIQSEDTGEVTIGPGSRMRLMAANNQEQRFDLRRGIIHANIWAPPGQFIVDTPSSKAIDLGCRYTLEVSKDGTGLLTVEMGWVAFESNKIESFIPAGAACLTHIGRGPGVPYFTDASPSLTNALASFDISGDPAALATAIAASRPRDALSIWHLMLRTQDGTRARLYDRLASLITLTPGAKREAILQDDPKAIHAAWNALDLGDIEWWRSWKRKW